MIKISAFADEAFASLDGQIRFLKSAGIKWLEIRFVDGRNVSTLTEAEATDVRKKLDDAGIGISVRNTVWLKMQTMVRMKKPLPTEK